MRRSLLPVLYLFVLILSTSCEDDPASQEYESQRPIGTIPDLSEYINGGMPVEKLEEFKIPDSLDKKLIIAVYDEELPQAGRTFLLYNDSTRTTVTKLSYLKNSSCKKEELLKIRDDQFKSKFNAENYTITSDKVFWSYQSGALSTSYEYVRMY